MEKQKHTTQDFIRIGHQEIDSQHLELEQLMRQLDSICEMRGKTASSCSECPTEHRAACTDKLATLSEGLLEFLIRHFSYEDKLMRQLLPTHECQQHVADHKWAHTEIASQVTEEIENLDYKNPSMSSFKIQNVISSCMGAHITRLDVKLASHLASDVNSSPAQL